MLEFSFEETGVGGVIVIYALSHSSHSGVLYFHIGVEELSTFNYDANQQRNKCAHSTL